MILAYIDNGAIGVKSFGEFRQYEELGAKVDMFYSSQGEHAIINPRVREYAIMLQKRAFERDPTEGGEGELVKSLLDYLLDKVLIPDQTERKNKDGGIHPTHRFYNKMKEIKKWYAELMAKSIKSGPATLGNEIAAQPTSSGITPIASTAATRNAANDPTPSEANSTIEVLRKELDSFFNLREPQLDQKNCSVICKAMQSQVTVESVEKLLLQGARSDEPSAPLHWASFVKSGPHVALLKKFLETPNLKVDCKDKNGKTPLQLASESGQYMPVMELLNYYEKKGKSVDWEDILMKSSNRDVKKLLAGRRK